MQCLLRYGLADTAGVLSTVHRRLECNLVPVKIGPKMETGDNLPLNMNVIQNISVKSVLKSTRGT